MNRGTGVGARVGAGAGEGQRDSGRHRHGACREVAHRQGAGVGGPCGGGHRAGHGQAAGRRKRGGNRPCGGAERFEQEVVAGSCRCGALLNVKAIDLDRIGGPEIKRCGFAVRQAHDGAGGARGERHLVIRCHQLGRARRVGLNAEAQGGARRGVGVGRIAIRHGGEREQGRTWVAVEVQAQGLLLVHARADGQGHATQHVAGIDQVFVLETQQSRDFSATQHAGIDRVLGTAHIDQQLALVGIARVIGGSHLQLRYRGAEHQGLATAHKDADGTVCGRDRGRLDVLVQFADQLIALVQQVIGQVAAAHGTRDFLIGFGDLGGQVVDGRDVGLQLL